MEAARSAASFMDGCVGAGEAADAAETRVNVRKTCTCMHTLRATSDPQGHRGRAHRAGRQGFSSGFYENKKLGEKQIRIAYVLNKESIIKAVTILRKGLETYQSLHVTKEKIS